jgi:hypothetical protein
MTMLGLITDRTERNVYRRNELSAKGWAGMTAAERKEWSGDPFETEGANLIPPGPYYSATVNVKHRNRNIIATATAEGTYLYAICIIGEAVNFVSKTLTLSVGSISVSNGGTPQIAAWWHDDNGLEYAGASMSVSGSMTFNTADFPNTAGRRYLALYIYVTTAEAVSPGAAATFKDVMLEIGDTPHEYVPYTEIVATAATKGAYNYSDLNRVERAVAEISDMAGLGLVTKTDWTMWDVPTESDMNRFLGNINVLRTRYSNQFSLPNSMSHLTYETANNIEKIINVAYEKVAT